MPTFTPPLRSLVPWVGPATPAWQRHPFASLTPHIGRGVNVWKLTNGTYTETQPSDESTIAVTYHGGHAHTVTSAEATALTNAGYGANITDPS